MFSFKSIIKSSIIAVTSLAFITSCNSTSSTLSSNNLMFSVSSYQSSFLFIPNRVFNVVYDPPSYVNSSIFSEKPLTFGDAEYPLSGTLTIPKTKGKYPVVVLIHGSGPNDRDESLGANKPFRDIAWSLASQGIATFRYEKRTKIYAEKMIKIKDGFTVKEEVTDDAHYAVKFLKTQNDIDTNKVFILGHDLGGMLAPRIADNDPNIAGVIIMAGNTKPLEDVMSNQVENSTFISTGDKNKFKNQVNNVKLLNKNSSLIVGSLPYDITPKYWLDLNNYSQTDTAKSLNKPILIIQGEKDEQVDMNNFIVWKNALSGQKNVTFYSYPDLNHLFFVGKLQDDNNKPNHINESVIKDLITWIKSN